MARYLYAVTSSIPGLAKSRIVQVPIHIKYPRFLDTLEAATRIENHWMPSIAKYSRVDRPTGSARRGTRDTAILIRRWKLNDSCALNIFSSSFE